MLLRHVPVHVLSHFVESVSASEYGGNVRVEANDGGTTRFPSVRFVLRVNDSKGPGARRSGSGRRTVAACWHVHRDLFAHIFTAYPEARLTSALADYKGRAGFLADFPGTARHNAGSIIAPVAFSRLCECDGPAEVVPDDSYTRARPQAPEFSYIGPDAFTMRFHELTAEADAEMASWREILTRR